jgi:hypothetical protein
LCPVGQIHGAQGSVDAAAGVGHLVQVSEASEVLGHAQAQVKPRRLGHDRVPAADLHSVLGVSEVPATVAEPEVGAIRVLRVRTVVVFPAPFGPRKPNTSP